MDFFNLLIILSFNSFNLWIISKECGIIQVTCGIIPDTNIRLLQIQDLTYFIIYLIYLKLLVYTYELLLSSYNN